MNAAGRTIHRPGVRSGHQSTRARRATTVWRGSNGGTLNLSNSTITHRTQPMASTRRTADHDADGDTIRAARSFGVLDHSGGAVTISGGSVTTSRRGCRNGPLCNWRWFVNYSSRRRCRLRRTAARESRHIRQWSRQSCNGRRLATFSGGSITTNGLANSGSRRFAGQRQQRHAQRRDDDPDDERRIERP